MRDEYSQEEVLALTDGKIDHPEFDRLVPEAKKLQSLPERDRHFDPAYS